MLLVPSALLGSSRKTVRGAITLLNRFLVRAAPFALLATSAEAEFRAGAAQIDINPRHLPVIINCGFLERTGTELRGNLFARAIVLEDSKTRAAIVVVDSCMMPRELIDKAKELASSGSGIAVDRMLISATHTHSAPAAMACLGSRQQKDYADWLPGRIAEAVLEAAAKLEPARVGAAGVDAPRHTFCRRWIYQSAKMLQDPFGETTVRANMIPGFENPDVISPSGPVDSELSLVVFQSRQSGKPIAVLANYGNHYFGASGVSPDYFGLFDQGLAAKIGGGIVMMSQGASGDANTNDYSKPKPTWTIDEYASGLVDLAHAAYRQIRYESGVPVRMAEARLELGRRLANAQRLAWAEETVRNQKGEKPANQPEVYAQEQLFLRSTPRRELKLQALRIGNIALTAIPNEVYAITGLKLKAQSPLARTVNIELANGAEGYIPPPEQHAFGGYTTWAARTAGLEPGAEPKIVESVLGLLEKVAEKPRRALPDPRNASAIAQWRLDEFDYGLVRDSGATGKFPGKHEGRVALRLEGATAGSASVYLAGGSIAGKVEAGTKYTIKFQFWPGRNDVDMELLAVNGRPVFQSPAGIAVREWHSAAFTRNGKQLQVAIDGKTVFESGTEDPEPLRHLRMGAGFEGKIDDVRVTSR